ncbi:hypothetical protein [Microbacterium paulum]
MRHSVVQDGGDAVRIRESSCRGQAWQERVDVVVVGFRAAQLSR